MDSRDKAFEVIGERGCIGHELDHARAVFVARTD